MKHWSRYIALHQINSQFSYLNMDALFGCIIIPCYNEPDILKVLDSLQEANKPGKKWNVIVVVNAGENTPQNIIDQNRKTYAELIEARNNESYAHFQLIALYVEDTPKKHAGVGYARKVGMDYAIGVFNAIKNYKGVLVSLDADCRVSENYFTALENAYMKDKALDVATHYFEHDLPTDSTEEAIVLYELYLRYFRLAMYYSNFPYSIHTVGSAFSVTADTYVLQGGMNRRQGGEDFYFLHKVVPHATFEEINELTVYPSARLSDRVPFGTGPAIKKMIEKQEGYMVYHPDSFSLLRASLERLVKSLVDEEKEFADIIPDLDAAVAAFLESIQFNNKWDKLKQNTASKSKLRKRFFDLFDAFQCIKLLNELHPKLYQKMDVQTAARILLEKLGEKTFVTLDAKSLLFAYRKLDRSGRYAINLQLIK